MPKERPHTGIQHALLLFLALWALAFVGKYLFIAYHTLGYPFQLEWMEGGTLDVVARIRAGEAIYTAPTVDYAAYIYTPLYYWASALSAHLFGLELLSARVVSLAATLGSATLIHLLVHRETKSHAWGLVGVGLFMATYDASGKWFHLARVDSLALFFVLLSFALLRAGRGWRTALAAAVLACLGVFTKQTMLPVMACVFLAMFFVDRKRSIVAGAAFGALCLVSFVGLEFSSDGWFSYYTVWLPSSHPVDPWSVRRYLLVDLGTFAPVAIIGIVWVGLILRSDRRLALMYGGLAVGCLVAALISRGHTGGYLNVLMPMHAALALVGALAAPGLIEVAKPRMRSWAVRLPVAIALVLAVQFGILEYRVSRCLPPPDALRVGNAFLERLEVIEGEVLLPDHRWLQTRVGKRSYALGMAARDVLRAGSPGDRGRELLRESLAHAIREQHFGAVILSTGPGMTNSDPMGYDLPGLRERYRRAGKIESPAPITGWLIRPTEVWLPRRPK